MTSRRVFLAGGAATLGLGALGANAVSASGRATVRVADAGAARPISPWVYGDNAIGRMDGGLHARDAAIDARSTIRRLGGNLMSTYNWTNNASNSGKDWKHYNGRTLGHFIGIEGEAATRPAAVIERVHEDAQAMGAATIVTLPVSGHVAADADGPVSPEERAPSARWIPVVWRDTAKAEDPIDPSVADMGHLLRRLIARYGSAAEDTGIRIYALDNEPALWRETHPLARPEEATAERFIADSIAAARIIRRIDPTARIIGPSSWGLTGYLDFHGRFRRRRGRQTPNFLAAYLDAFRKASDREGARLLDAIDVHWYPQSDAGELFRTEDPALTDALLQAPRSLSEPGFRERSWVGGMRRELARADLDLPILPSLRALCDAWFPGTQVAVTEFNYGGPGGPATTLALADALGRFGREGVAIATHWGALEGAVCEAYRLFRGETDAEAYPDFSLATWTDTPQAISAFAARDAEDGRLSLMLINKDAEPRPVTLALDRPGRLPLLRTVGVDRDRPQTTPIDILSETTDEEATLLMPGRSVRRLDFGPRPV